MDGRIGGNERKYVEEVLASGFRASTSSTMMKRLEDAFAARFGSGYAISFANGTATLHAALEAAGIGPGDEVIVPPLTMSSTTFGAPEEPTPELSVSAKQSRAAWAPLIKKVYDADLAGGSRRKPARARSAVLAVTAP